MSDEVLGLANNIRILRKAKGLNQEQLANKLNIKRSNIAAYETKNVEPRLRIILEMGRFFNIDISTLLKEKLTADSTYPPFMERVESQEGETAVVDVNHSNVNEFITRSARIKKILVGFKSFYTFRKSKMIEITPKNQKIIFDIDNFIQLMEDLITHNEAMMTLIAPPEE